MAAVEQQILVRIKNLVEGLPQVQALSQAVRDLSKTNGSNGLKQTAAQVVNLGSVSDKTVKSVSTLFSGFQNVSKGFAEGSLNVRKFTSDLAGAATEMKAITDQSRLLGPAQSIQLPSRNPVFETLKPLVGGDTVEANNSARALRTEAEAVDRVRVNAQRLAEAWTEANAAGKKQIEILAAVNAETNAAFKNILSGGSAGNKAGGVGAIASEAEKAKKPVQDVVNEVEQVGTKAEGASTFVTGLLRSLGRIVVISAIFAAFYAIVNSIKDAISATIDGIKAFVGEGIRYNAVLETSKISLASLIASTSDIKDEQGNLVTGIDKFTAAEKIAGNEMTKIQAIAIATRYEFEDILQAVTLATAAVGGTNVTLSQTLSLVSGLARAAAAVRLNPSQFQTQVRQILTGATRIQTTLATALFPGQTTTNVNKQIQDWRKAGTLVDELNKKLEVFQLTANEVEGTFDALASNVVDAFKVFTGQSTLPLFDKLKETLKFILGQIIVFNEDGVKLTPTFQKVADILSTILGQIGTDLLNFVKQIAQGFSDWVGAIKAAPDTLKGIGDDLFSIAENVAGIVADFVQLIGYTFGFGDGVKGTAGALSGVAVAIGGIRDLLKIIYGIIGLINDFIKGILGSGILLVLTAVDALTGKIDVAADRARILAGYLKAIFTRDFSTLEQGVAGADIPGAAKGASGSAGLQSKDNFTAFPRRVSGDEKAANDRTKRERINTLRQLNEAARDLYLQNKRNEIDIQNQTDEEILKQEQRRFDEGLISAQEFYDKKEKLAQDNVDREIGFLKDKQDAEKENLRNQLAAIEGQATITDDKFQGILDRFNAADRNNLNPNDTVFNKQVTEILKSQKNLKSIQAEINKLLQDSKNITDDRNNATEDSVRLNKQLATDIKGQLADALGSAGISDELNLTKRISDELPKLFSEFGKGIPGLKEAGQAIRDLGNASMDQVLGALDTFNIDIDSLPAPLQTVINLFKQLQTANSLTQSSSRASRLTDSLKFDLEGIRTGLDKGEIGLSDAVTQSQDRKREAILALNKEFEKQKEILDTLPQPKTDAELAHYNELTQKVAALGRAIETLGNNEEELALISDAAQKANDQYGSTIDQIAIKRQRFGITAAEADREEIKAKQILIAQLQEQLAVAEMLNQTVPANAQQVQELITRIGQLQNEVGHNTLDLAHGIEDSIGGAFNNFFDAITQGNQGILDSFRQVVSQMLLEIAKLIFQAYVLKSIMSAIHSFIGQFIPGGGGVTGGVAGDHAAGFAEGGIVSGPGTGVSDSVPAMLSHGEAVIPARNVSAYGRGFVSSLISGSWIPTRGFARFAEGGFAGSSQGSGVSGQGSGHTRIINVLDKSLVSDYMNSAEGEKVIVNIIGKNRGLLQRLA